MEYFVNVFTEFSEFSDKNICHYSKRIRTCHLLCKRPGCYHSVSKKHVIDRIFESNLCFSDLSDSLNSMKVLFHLGKTPMHQYSSTKVTSDHAIRVNC